MKTFSFVHTSDLHLDSPFLGVSEINPAVGSLLSRSTFQAFRSIIELCIEKKVAFLLISGDIYDGENRSLRAQIEFRNEMIKLSEAGISVFVIHGNHDPLEGWSPHLEWPKNVHIFSGDNVETINAQFQGEPVASISGISFSKRKISANLSRKFPKISPSKKKLFSVAMLHCLLQGSSGHESYSPCNLNDLTSKNMDYWALGHVHTHSIISEKDPLVIYPGNPQGLSPRETGARGCYLIRVDTQGDMSSQFIETDAVRWFVEELSIENIMTEEDLLSALDKKLQDIRNRASGRPVVCRIFLVGRGPLYSTLARKGVLEDVCQEIREMEESESIFVWLESLHNHTSPKIDRRSIKNREDFVGSLLNLFDEFYKDKDTPDTLLKALDPLFSSPGGRKYLEVPDRENLMDLLKRAEQICLDRLLKGDPS